MAATSPRGGGGGGCGGYSSRGPGRRRAALPRAPGSSAMFRQTSPTPRAVSPPRRAAPRGIRSGSAPARGHLLGRAAAPPCAPLPAPPRPLPPAAPSARPGPPPRPDPRAPGLSRPPRGSALPRLRLAHFPGAASRGPLGSEGCFFCFVLFFPLGVWRFSPPSSPGFNPRGWIPGGVGRAGGGWARSAGVAATARAAPRGELECVRELPAGPRAPPVPGTQRALNKYLLNE
ncbi:MAPK-interacting and spindle-stabilizing protein-like [Neofelis nebulosa]|uniref:MAPK-interacting and spindle-stabilizing protein-like n=1 Tax=Neofelis nebulosa TaxID=61452 RepID=UPI00272ABED0|nr:MAPK-interacting and spindle-stabilizing protein-like [Neofelis nebulosa]